MEIENEAVQEQESETVEQQEDPTLARMRELEELEEQLRKRERDLNKGFMEISERERRLQTQAAPKDEDDDLPEMQPEAEKILNKFVEKKIAPILQSQQELYSETVNSELEEAAKKYGVTEDDIVETIDKVGLAPKDGSLRAAREVISAAAEIVKAKSFNQSELEKRIREQVLKELAETGAEVAGVRPSRELPSTPNIPVDDMSSDERYRYLKSLEGL